MPHDAETYRALAVSVMAAVETADALARGIIERGDAGIAGGEIEKVLGDTASRARMALVEFAIDANQTYDFLSRRHRQLVQYSRDYSDWELRHEQWQQFSVLAPAGGGGPGPEPLPPTPPFPGAMP